MSLHGGCRAPLGHDLMSQLSPERTFLKKEHEGEPSQYQGSGQAGLRTKIAHFGPEGSNFCKNSPRLQVSDSFHPLLGSHHCASPLVHGESMLSWLPPAWQTHPEVLGPRLKPGEKDQK